MEHKRSLKAGFLKSLVVTGAIIFLSACRDDSSDTATVTETSSEGQLTTVRMNEVQYLGTHNSYHPGPPEDVVLIVNNLTGDAAEAAEAAGINDLMLSLDYAHVSLTEQFESQGVRQIELDVFHDPEGGRYKNRNIVALLGKNVDSGIDALAESGLKVLHIQDLDYESTCYTFIACLTEIKTWSDNNPDHLPITVLVEAKDEIIPDPLGIGFVEPLPFTTEALNQIDIEIRSVFPESQIITPDVVRGDYETLNAAVLAREWPLLSEVKGKVLFAFDNAGSKRDAYISGHPSLTGRVMFTDSEPGSPEAAFLKFNDPESSFDQIQNFVAQGYMVRTRADSDTVEARTNNTTRSEEALRSGAHFISTDYPVPDLRFSDYQVSIPGGYITRCNPISAPNNCEDSEW